MTNLQKAHPREAAGEARHVIALQRRSGGHDLPQAQAPRG